MKKILGFVAICIVVAGVSFARTRQDQQKQSPTDNTQVAPNASSMTLIPLHIKLGQWQSTSTVTVKGGLGLPPDMAAKLTPEQRARYEAYMKSKANGDTHTMTDKNCITAKDLTTDPFEQKDPDGKFQCHGTLLHSSSSDITLQENCSGEANMTYTMKIHASDPEHTTGTGEGSTTMGGRTMTSTVKFSSTWIGATCPNASN